MAKKSKGVQQFCDWRCPDCNFTVMVNTYNKRNNDTVMKEKSIFCPKCRAHKVCTRKNTSSGSLGNKR